MKTASCMEAQSLVAKQKPFSRRRLREWHLFTPTGTQLEVTGSFPASCPVAGLQAGGLEVGFLSPDSPNRRLLTNQTQISRSSSPDNNPRMSSFFSPRKGGWRQPGEPSQRPKKLSYKQMALANSPSADPHNLEANAVLGPVMWQCCCNCRQSQM
jgi:hypothetical protein